VTGTYPVPTPPYAEGTGLPWDVPVGDAVAVIAAARARYGDTFVVESGHEHCSHGSWPAKIESGESIASSVAGRHVVDDL
jgi:hypothetical protein